MPDGRNLSFAPKRGGYLEGKRRWRYLRGYGMLKKERKAERRQKTREKLRKYGSDILYYSLSFIATLIAWLAHDLDRIGVLKEVDFALELMWWLILMLFAWAGELLPVEEPDYGPEINRRNRKIVAITEIVLTVLVTAIFIAQLVTGEMFLWRLF